MTTTQAAELIIAIQLLAKYMGWYLVLAGISMLIGIISLAITFVGAMITLRNA